MQAEIVVMGCGIAGSMAAAAAARMGKRVLAIDEAGYPGGALTAMGTGPMMTFHAGREQVIRGLPQELIDRLMAAGESPGHCVDSTGYTYTVTPFSSEGMKTALEQMMLEAGVTLLYHTTVIDARVRDGRLESIECFACGRRFEVCAEVFIDATGDADVLALAGVPFALGREPDGKDQPMTMNFKVCNVDTTRIRAVMAEHPEQFPHLAPRAGIERQALRLSVYGFDGLVREAACAGELTVERDTVLCFETNTPGEMIVNMSRVTGENPIDPLSLSRAETEGRRQVREIFTFLKARVPGFEEARLELSGPGIGVRSSRRMLGDYVLTAEDILANRLFEDDIAVCGYPIDIHSSDGAETTSRFLRWGTVYGIPYRCLTNSVVSNLMAAGRDISCTFEAQASTRVSPCCAALGHAAGAAAALAVQNGCRPHAVDMRRLRETLEKQGAYIR